MNLTKYLFTRVSSNAKTGPIPVVIAGRDSCPPSCPLYNGGCYALSGPMAMHWRRTTDRGVPFDELLTAIGTLPARQVWRYATAGDLPGEGDTINAAALARLVRANGRRTGFTYTHKPPTGANAKAIQAANKGGFTVNLSSNTAAQADDYLALGIAPVCTIVPHDERTGAWKAASTPGGARIVQCPAEYNDIQCATCGGAGGPLCARADRNYVIGFTTHGTGKRKAANVARGLAILQ